MYNLNSLAKYVLFVLVDGVSKVRFAKILYFTHKALVQNKFVEAKELRFIRMPLGPVPVGFMSLSQDVQISVISMANVSLSYDSQLYKLSGTPDLGLDDTVKNLITEVVPRLNELSTSVLVEESHKDPSWINFPNGKEYVLSNGDIDVPLPLKKKNIINKEMDNQYLQATLVEGLMEEIVDETTLLEYPKSDK